MTVSKNSFDSMIRDVDFDILESGLHDALKLLKDTPLFDEAKDSYLKAIEEAEKLDIQLAKDSDVLTNMHERSSGATAFRVEKLKKQYDEGCANSDARGYAAAAIASLRSRRPQPVADNDGEEMAVVEVVRSHRDPLGGGLIKDPVKSKYCGHVYDRKTLQQYIDDNRARRNACYQCPYSLCKSKKNMDMGDMIDCPEFLLS
ncbi:hypothetical protein OESDEN_13846 [Oesophagostomum dentatum]|uniref:E3 SUMO-protein ligase NSE2 n=1 Tax=Oesophagostomum dentatum TaxID=61180 RepID=A0A0B1SN84_OESDE|nr:hypothetical protein OESDEN_13846 [Oesophagostomum dentatum]